MKNLDNFIVPERLAPSINRDNREPSQLEREARFVSLLDLLVVQVDSFAMCEIEDGCGLVVPPSDKLVAHYVLEGEGTIVSDQLSLPIKAGMVIVVPRGLAKQINGRGLVRNLLDAESFCPLVPGIVKFGSPSGAENSLILGCATVHASLVPKLSMFEDISMPLVCLDQNQIATSIFRAILQELSNPGIGAKALVDTLMKQILLLLLRDNLQKSGLAAPTDGAPTDSQIARAIDIIMTRPQDPHTVHKLAHLVGMSRSSFTRNFADKVGMSPMRYVQAARLTLASALLKSLTIPIKSIAASVGYASRSQFSRAFVSMFGADPTTFRQQAQRTTRDSGDRDPATQDFLQPQRPLPSPVIADESRGQWGGFGAGLGNTDHRNVTPSPIRTRRSAAATHPPLG